MARHGREHGRLRRSWFSNWPVLASTVFASFCFRAVVMYFIVRAATRDGNVFIPRNSGPFADPLVPVAALDVTLAGRPGERERARRM
jgi:hypothetical protein